MKLKHLLAVAAVAAVTGAGASYAAVADSGTISACVDANGKMTVIDPTADQVCGADQQPLTWNKQGPAGPVGPQGPAGQDAKIDVVQVAANGSLVSSSRPDITVTHEKLGVYRVAIPNGGSCRRWVTFENSPRHYTAQWIAQQGALYVGTYLPAGISASNSPFTLYLSC